jgi:hypothetical protein
MACAAIFNCNTCGTERASGEFKGHRSGMRDSGLYCAICETKTPHSFVRHIWDDTSPEEWESLIASEPSQNWKYQGSIYQGENKMITLQRNNIPDQPSNAQRGVQFLKPSHIPVNGKDIGSLKAKVYKVTTDKPDGFGNPVVVYFQTPGQKYSKSFKYTSDNLAMLVDLLGADETKWIGKAVTISKTVTEDGERLTFGK